MNDLRTAAQQALEALEWFNRYGTEMHGPSLRGAEHALKAALAEPVKPVQEPVLRYDALHEYAAQHRLDYNKLCSVVRAALAEPVQEPVAWLSPASQSMIGRDDGEGSAYHIITTSKATGNHTIPLYTAPPQRKPLTDDEIDRITDQEWAANNHKPIYAAHRAFARAIERAHGIGEKR